MSSTRLLSVTDLSKILKVPTGTICFWVSKKQVPFIKFGKHIRFEYEVVIEHFKSRPSSNSPLLLQ